MSVDSDPVLQADSRVYLRVGERRGLQAAQSTRVRQHFDLLVYLLVPEAAVSLPGR